MLIIGLTGGIGSGKTMVADLFAKLKVPLVDADAISRELTTKNPDVLANIKEHFGETVFLSTGKLNRPELRKIIFSNKTEKTWLENLLHPMIRTKMQEIIQTLNSPYCIAIIPLLFEGEFKTFPNRILVVDANESLQVERVMLRDKCSANEVHAMLAAQVSRETRLHGAHDVIENNGDPIDLVLQVSLLHKKYLALAKS